MNPSESKRYIEKLAMADHALVALNRLDKLCRHDHQRVKEAIEIMEDVRDEWSETFRQSRLDEARA